MLETYQTFRKQDSVTAVFQEIIRFRKLFVQKIQKVTSNLHLKTKIQNRNKAREQKF